MQKRIFQFTQHGRAYDNDRDGSAHENYTIKREKINGML
jgi:hypothetical protein